ncbi:hypothetical protein GTP23_09065 [Pseudoduganella sp. FT93W]|uniref:Uncharacterized protein n=1 Tax=Duganella fentianensis TaxID=2692177 RepID=A0A845HVQ5_9BURK|nr:hypothetical protein [Duganella fentianensis]MYN45210.1 hypothetical protein [Duganella fentianensis]
MRYPALLVLLAAAIGAPAQADPQSAAFAQIYSSLCLKHLAKVDELRLKLKDMPSLPAEKAEGFLQGRPGKAWPVPDKHGVFVLALQDGKDVCSVFAHRADAQAVEADFLRLVQTAPAPLTSQLIENGVTQSARNGRTRTVVYAWSLPQAKRKMIFTLTTATGEAANLQAMATASMGQ